MPQIYVGPSEIAFIKSFHIILYASVFKTTGSTILISSTALKEFSILDLLSLRFFCF